MPNRNAMTEMFEEVTIFDKPALFTCGRINRDTVPIAHGAYAPPCDTKSVQKQLIHFGVAVFLQA